MPISGFYLEEIAQNCEGFVTSTKMKVTALFDFYGKKSKLYFIKKRIYI